MDVLISLSVLWGGFVSIRSSMSLPTVSTWFPRTLACSSFAALLFIDLMLTSIRSTTWTLASQTHLLSVGTAHSSGSALHQSSVSSVRKILASHEHTPNMLSFTFLVELWAQLLTLAYSTKTSWVENLLKDSPFAPSDWRRRASNSQACLQLQRMLLLLML